MDDRFGRLSLSRTGWRGLSLCAAFFWVAVWAAVSTATSSGAVPPGRGLEQVSPPNKNGGDAVIGGSQGLSGESFSYASKGPGRVVYNSFGAFAGAPSGYLNQYLAERTPSGWINKPLTPRQGVPNFPDFTIGFTGFACDSCGTVIGGIPWPGDPEDENEVPDVYTTTGNLQWARQSVGELPNVEGAGFPITSGDGSVYTFLSTSPLTTSATETEPGNQIAYFRTGGVTKPVAEKSDGKMLNSGGSWVGGTDTRRIQNAVARDGFPIFFESPWSGSGGLRHVQARLENGQIIRLDESQCTGACAPQTTNASWVGATPDGSIAYFTTDEQLLDSAAPVKGLSNLYSYEVGTGKLTFIAPDAGWTGDNYHTGFWGASDDGSRVYITSHAELASNANGAGATAEAGNINNTYLVEYDAAHPDGRYVFLGHGPGEGFEMARVSGVSPSGRYAMLWTNARITSDYEGGTQQVYLYDAFTEAAECLSCGSSPLSAQETVQRPYGPSDDGAVVFATPQALDPTDVNGLEDVYLHESGIGGSDFLLSGGQNEIRSEPVGMSRDGTDVYFATFSRLLKSDIDGNKDVYDARVGGGFPDPVVAGECEGDGCSGAVSAPPPAVAPGSSTYVGPPNAKAKHRKHKKKRHGKRRHGHRHHIHRASRVHG